jgi:hypothetical protein
MKESLAGEDLDAEALVNKFEPWEQEIELEPFAGFFGEYRTRVFNFGLATMFVVAFPAAPAIMLLITTAQCRLLAHRLCTQHRRPNPVRREDMGPWQGLMGFMCWICLVTNAGVLVFTSNTFAAHSSDARAVLFLAIVLCLMALQAIVHAVMPTESDRYKGLVKRHEFLVEKHISGFQDLTGATKPKSAAGGGEGGKGGKGRAVEGDDGSAKRGHIVLGPLEEQFLKKAESSGLSTIPELREVDEELEQVRTDTKLLMTITCLCSSSTCAVISA